MMDSMNLVRTVFVDLLNVNTAWAVSTIISESLSVCHYGDRRNHEEHSANGNSDLLDSSIV